MRSLNTAIGYLKTKPLEHFMNIVVISIIVALVSVVFVVNNALFNFEKYNVSFPQIAIYLKVNSNHNDVDNLEAVLNREYSKHITGYQFISKTDALNSMQQDSNLKQIASGVDQNNNPLPDVLLVNTNITNTNLLNQLSAKMKSMYIVDDIDLDNAYASKLSDLFIFIHVVSVFLQIVFTVMFVLVVYNIIRLQMMLRQDEILISRLIGASDGFIMTPLIYYAIIQVLISGLIAYGLVYGFIAFINGLFLQLNSLFGHSFVLSLPNLNSIIEVLLLLSLFTVFAVFIAVRWVFCYGNT